MSSQVYLGKHCLTKIGVRTLVFARFSTVIGSKDSPETARPGWLRHEAQYRGCN